MGIEGILVTLSDENGVVIDSVLTDENGNYLFDGLPAGTYTVSVPTTGLNDETLTTPESFTVTLAAGEEDLTLDFGYEPAVVLSSLGDYVWLDVNADGIQDATDVPLENVSIELYNGDGTSTGQTTTTDATGFYEFTDLLPGDYYVIFTSPTDANGVLLTQSPQDAGGDDSLDSDIGSDGDSPTVT